MTLNYAGQEIDICGADEFKLFDAPTGQWRLVPADLHKSEEREVFGIKVPIVAKEDLINYKAMLARDTDLADIEAIK